MHVFLNFPRKTTNKIERKILLTSHFNLLMAKFQKPSFNTYAIELAFIIDMSVYYTSEYCFWLDASQNSTQQYQTFYNVRRHRYTSDLRKVLAFERFSFSQRFNTVCGIIIGRRARLQKLHSFNQIQRIVYSMYLKHGFDGFALG